jgi:hypothetical protein
MPLHNVQGRVKHCFILVLTVGKLLVQEWIVDSSYQAGVTVRCHKQ